MFKIVLLVLTALCVHFGEAVKFRNGGGHYMTFVLEYGQRTCYYVDASPKDYEEMRITAIIFKHNPGDLEISIKDRNGVSQEIDKNTEQAKFNLQKNIVLNEQNRGDFEICFSDIYGKGELKIFFAYFFTTEESRTESNVERSVLNIKKSLDQALQYNKMISILEYESRQSVETLFEVINWRSFYVCIALVAVGIIEVFYVRHWFSNSSARF